MKRARRSPPAPADARLDDLITTLARALSRTRQRCARQHLQRLQARLYRGGTLQVQRWHDGGWQPLQVALDELVPPGGILASTLEVQIDCDIEELGTAAADLPLPLVLSPIAGDAPHRLTIVLHGGTPIHGELLLDGQRLRSLRIDVADAAHVPGLEA
ncbi:hypothetical protein [Stenotrophomonas sp.]|uniref:hypothetical protein n=1 Tax=Stenotrophomonas sp. TaxID=69392 RepID=UPI0028AD764B|nr:hypothetical protein [Stenotrophomonas sp.]